MNKPNNPSEREAKLAILRQALIEGEESGPAEDFDVEAFITERNAEYEASRQS